MIADVFAHQLLLEAGNKRAAAQRQRIFLRRAAVEGDVDNGSLMAGQSVGLVDKVMTVRELIDELLEGAEDELVELKAKLCGC